MRPVRLFFIPTRQHPNRFEWNGAYIVYSYRVYRFDPFPAGQAGIENLHFTSVHNIVDVQRSRYYSRHVPCDVVGQWFEYNLGAVRPSSCTLCACRSQGVFYDVYVRLASRWLPVALTG